MICRYTERGNRAPTENKYGGTFRVNLWVGNLFTEAGASVEALLDTGATYSMIPGSLLEELGIKPVETRVSRIADGSRVELQTSWARFFAEGRNAVASVSFGPEGIYVLGATALKDMGLAVDPVDHWLVTRESLLM